MTNPVVGCRKAMQLPRHIATMQKPTNSVQLQQAVQWLVLSSGLLASTHTQCGMKTKNVNRSSRPQQATTASDKARKFWIPASDGLLRHSSKDSHYAAILVKNE
jgi:hypothetical protein